MSILRMSDCSMYSPRLKSEPVVWSRFGTMQRDMDVGCVMAASSTRRGQDRVGGQRCGIGLAILHLGHLVNN